MYVIYTSGSTGTPKGVLNTHRALCNRLRWMQETYQLTGEDRVLQKTPLSFDVSGWEIFWPLLTGAKLIFAVPEGQKDSSYLAKLIAEQQITTLHFVPSMLRVFLEEPRLRLCTSLKRVFCSGEALPFDLKKRFFERIIGMELHNLYGPTEAAIDVTFWDCQQNTESDIVPIGRPIANTQIHILDQYLQPVPVNIPGELHIGGIALARGYFKRPELTAEKFIPNPLSEQPGERLYKTGDLARYLPDGNIEFLGRLDHQVKIRGFRIELGEIETILGQHPAVKEAVVLVHEYLQGDKSLAVYVTTIPKQMIRDEELREYLKKRLPAYMIPSIFVKVDNFPLTPNGKVDRQVLLALESVRPDRDKQYVAPRDTLEWKLTEIWEKVLGVHPIGIDDNFFDLGGHSLLLVRLFALIEEVFGEQLPLALLFQKPTIAQFATMLRQEDWPLLGKSLFEIQPKGTQPPFFMIHGGAAVMTLSRYLGEEQPVYFFADHLEDGKLIPGSSIGAIAAEQIKEMRSVQPEGPYFLGGYCIGGVIAFEMARQLHAQGDQIAGLFLIDPSIPGIPQPASVASNRFAPVSSLPQLWFLKLLTMVVKKINRILLRMSREFDLLKNWAVSFTFQKAYANKVYAQAMQSYQPDTYSGKIVLCCRADNAESLLSFWKPLTTRGIEIHELHVEEHLDLIEKSYIPLWAKHIKTVLEKTHTRERD